MPDQVRIIIAVDDSDESMDAVRAAYRLFGPAPRYIIATVGRGPTPVLFPPPPRDTPTHLRLSVRQATAKASARPTAGAARQELPAEADTEIEVGLGDIGETLARIAGEQHADVIVLGSRDRNIWQRLFVPSIGRYLIDNAPCAVLVIR